MKNIEKSNNDKVIHKSILNLITENINENGNLPETFSLPKDNKNELCFADGAMDGIAIYHTGMPEIGDEWIEKIIMAAKAVSNKEIEKADELFLEITEKYRVIHIIDDIQRCIINNKDEINPDSLMEYAIYVLDNSENKELIKAAMSILELLVMPEEIKDKIRILGLSDEFTIFSVFLMRSWENGNEEIFELTKKVHGWGRIHGIEFLEPNTDEIKKWLLKEGVKNDIVPAYSGYTCYEKADIESLINKENVSYEELSSILNIIEAMIDEGPISGISRVENAEEVLINLIGHAKNLMPLEAMDYGIINNIKGWYKERCEKDKELELNDDNELRLKNSKNEEFGGEFEKEVNEARDLEILINSILESNECKKEIAFQTENGKYINLAIELNIPYEENLYKALEKNFDELYFNCRYIINNPVYTEKVIDLCRKNIPLDSMKTGSANEMGLGEKFADYRRLDIILSELRDKIGLGEDIVATAIQSPVISNRNGAIRVIQCWVNESGRPLKEVSKVLYDLLNEIYEDEVKEEIRNNIKELVDGKTMFE